LTWEYAAYDGGYSVIASDFASYDGAYAYIAAVDGIGAELNTNYQVARSIGTRFDPQAGWWSHWTQIIGNQFPPWHSARNKEFGQTQRFLNHAGQSMEEFERELQEFRRNSFIQSADTFQPDHAFRIYINRELRTSEGDYASPNLLRNPDFSIPGLTRYNLPWAWTDRFTATTGTVAHYTANSLTGTGCVKMTAASGEICYLKQAVASTVQSNDCITGSVWCLIPVDSTYTAGTARARLIVSVMYEDGSSEITDQDLPVATDGYWQRVAVTITCSKRASQADIMVHLDNSEGSRTWEVFLDAFQLEAAASTSAWSMSFERFPHWINETSRAPIGVQSIGASAERTIELVTNFGVTYDEVPHTRIWPLVTVEEWWVRAIPTRVDLVTPATEPTGIIRTRWGFLADENTRRRFNTGFRIQNNQIQLYVEDTPVDVVFAYSVADHFMDGNDSKELYGIYGEEDAAFTVTFEALTVHREKLWVIIKEVYEGTTTRVLKILKPGQAPTVLGDSTQTNFLETIQDFDVGDNTGTCNSVAFVDGDDTKLAVDISSTVKVLNLYYDYGFFDSSHITNLLLRHEYTGETLVVT
jgi:hypothetical protein